MDEGMGRASKLEYRVDAAEAELFEATMVPAVFGPWAPELVRLAGPAPGERVLDLACGTGVVARLAAQAVGATGGVSGCDINQGMLEVAERVAAEAGHQIGYHQGSADALPFDDNSFDLVMCQQGLQFFPDKPAALREILRVLAPAGRFAAAVWRSAEHCPGQHAFIRALEKHGFDATAARRPFAFYDAGELEAVAAAAGFQSVVVTSSKLASRFHSPQQYINVLAAGAPSMRMALEQAGEELREAVLADAAASLDEYMDGEGLEIPMESHLLMARR